jgi:Fe-S cluster assembly protein SufD
MSKLIKEDIDKFFIRQFEAFENSLNGESKKPLHAKRKQAIDNFKALGLPHAKHEEYKYSNIAKIFGKLFNVENLSDDSFSLSLDEASRYFIPELDAIRLVFVNGVLDNKLSDMETLPRGVHIQAIKTAADDYASDFEKHFNTHKIEGADNFSELNTAFTNGGVFVKIDANAVVETPIACYYFNDAKNADVISQPRNLVIAEKNSQASLIESYITLGENTSFTNVVTEIVMEDDCVFNYYKYQNESNQAIQVGATMVHQLGKSVFNGVTLSLNGAMLRNNLSIAIHKEHSETNMYGLYLLDGKTHVDNHTVVDHKVPNCESNEMYKGILDGQSRGVFNGKIFVRQDAQKTNAFQSNRNVVLSDDAEVDTKPQLEIWADDVQCSHGATVGQLDVDQLFYLRARGIDKHTAKSMLLNAFASDVLGNIKIEAFRTLIENKINERL